MDRKNSAPTLQDVARVAGVSTATVSRCFNTPDRVVESTRDRVLGVVNELGYTPHFGGRALASNRSNTVGAVIPTMENAIFARGLQAFQEVLADNGVTMLVASSGYDMERELLQIKSLISQGADGLLLIGHNHLDDAYEFLDRRQIPYVLTWNYRPDCDQYNVGFDNRRAACQLAKRVIDFGHRQIGIITAYTETNDRALDRVSGIRDAMQATGLSDDSLTIVPTTYSLKSGGEAFEQLMQQQPRPSAVMCGNDVLATGAAMRAKEMAIDIPQEVSITGFDDIDISEVIQPKLTTVHVPHRKMGAFSARLLLDVIDGKSEQQRLELATEIIMRDSLGPVFSQS